MQTEQCDWTSQSGWSSQLGTLKAAQLILLFGNTGLIEARAGMDELRSAYPNACIAGCSTGGEIRGTRVSETNLVATVVQFDSSHVVQRTTSVEKISSFEAGRKLGTELNENKLVHVLVLSEGLHISGSELVRGLRQALPSHVTISGGLAGNAAIFQRTVVTTTDFTGQDVASIVGFYGSHLKVGCASGEGWTPFGPERLITRSSGNVLHQLDDQSALELYKRYLGEHAAGLPATGLFFPLSIRRPGEESTFIRTIVAMDEEMSSLTFAGAIPEGSFARLMKASIDQLVEGACVGAREAASQSAGDSPTDLAILISCVGRKMLLKQRVEEEVEAVREVLGERTTLAGFYSYGEISSEGISRRCELHNQTMTVTTFNENSFEPASNA